MKRENLEARPFGLIIASSDFEFYAKPEADSVMDELEARIKELELALSNSREHEKALRKCFDNHRQRIKELDEQLHELAERECVLCKKKIKELEVVISKMETTVPKWISVKDRLPTSDTTQYLVYDEMTKNMEKVFSLCVLNVSNLM